MMGGKEFLWFHWVSGYMVSCHSQEMYLCFVIPVMLIYYTCYKWYHDNVQGRGIDDVPTLKTKNSSLI